MGRHLKHTLAVAAVVALAAAASWLASPAVPHFAERHPGVAVFIPLAAGLVDALRHALQKGAGGSA